MEMVLNSKKIAAIAIVFVLLLAGITYLAWPESSSSYSGPSVDSDLDTMTWAQIMKEAQGETVNLAFYRDTYNDQFFDEVLIPLATEYGVTVTYGDDLGYIGAMNDAQSGGIPKYDMYWMGVSGYDAFTGLWWNEDWKSVIPNTIYLTADTDSQVSYSINGNSTGYVGNEIEFSGGHFVFTYNANCEDPALAYNAMELGKGTTIKTIYLTRGSDSDTHTWADIEDGKTYAVDDIMTLLNSDSTLSVVYGLPHNYTELFSWIQIYPGQFTYCDTRGGHNSYYLGYSFMYGAAYELAWDTTKTSWIACSDSSAYYYDEYTAGVNTSDASAVKSAYAAWLDVQTEAVGDDPTALQTVLGYIYVYLDELDDYVYKVDGKSWYAEYQSEVDNKLVGYNTNDTKINDKTVLLSFTVVTSQVNRASTSALNMGIYAMETGILEKYCWTINNDSVSKAGCLVVANLLNDPYVQAMWYKITGEVPNIGLDKYLEYIGGGNGPYYEAQYDLYFGFIRVWSSDPTLAKLFISPEILAETAVDANLSKYYITLGSMWATELDYS
jgi:ABC-type uncharacterized transport system YnjBCD substrate-binding protein